MATTSIEAANLFNANGMVAVITGGGSGIGAMMARTLSLNGAEAVYIIGRREDALKKVAASVSTGNIRPLVGDVTSKESLVSLAAIIEKEVGYVNVVIANSGVGGPQSKPTAEVSLQDFVKQELAVPEEETLKTFEVNVVGVWYTFMSFLQLLDAGNKKGNLKQKSQVIATSSIASFNRAVPGGFAYGQSKAGTTALVKQLATNLVPYEIRANAIAPGLYPSDMADPIIAKVGGAWPKEKLPLQRVGSEEDMAGVVLFVTSLAGGYLNGNVVVTDGGRLSVMPGTY